MARSPRSRASIGNTTPSKEADTDFKTPRSSHNALRRQQYKRAKRAQKIHAVKAAIKSADGNSAARTEALTRKGELYRTWKPRSEKKVAELERVVKAQQAEIEELRRLAQGGAVVPKLEPVSTPRRGRGAVDEVDSSPVKIQQQLAESLAAAAADGEEPQAAVLRVEQAVEETAGGEDEVMDGVEEMTVATSIEKDFDVPLLPPDQAEEVKETVEEDAPLAQQTDDAQPAVVDEAAAAEAVLIEAKKQEIRDSSADTNAGTPRNIRRSPRKRTVKRRSLAGR